MIPIISNLISFNGFYPDDIIECYKTFDCFQRITFELFFFAALHFFSLTKNYLKYLFLAAVWADE